MLSGSKPSPTRKTMLFYKDVDVDVDQLRYRLPEHLWILLLQAIYYLVHFKGIWIERLSRKLEGAMFPLYPW